MTLISRLALLMALAAAPVKAADITVFAAASLGDAIADAAQDWEGETGNAVTLVLAGSSTLARQIDAGAPADVFVSANAMWMDWLENAGRIIPDTRRDIAANRLVLIAHNREMQSAGEITARTDLAAFLGAGGRLAMGLPEAVPVGIYAKDALTKLGLWDDVSTRLAPTDNVRAAMALVTLGEAPLGVVYATDALAEPRVSVVGTFPDDSHTPILYPATVVADSLQPEAAIAFLDWLTSEAGQAVLERYGFLPSGEQP